MILLPARPFRRHGGGSRKGKYDHYHHHFGVPAGVRGGDPALWKKIAGGTQYTLRLLPVGGYVAMEGEGSPESNQAERARDGQPGEAAENPIPPDQRTGIPFPEAAIWKRAIVISGSGPLSWPPAP